MTMRINSWPIEPDYTAVFDDDDFERWWLAGMTRTDPVSDDDRAELLENCIYLAKTENREMLQSADDLAEEINNWAEKWNQ